MNSLSDFSSYGDWELKKELGCGGFGRVLYWQNRRSQQEIATKALKENPNLAVDEIAKLKSRWQQEFELMHHVNMDYIVRGIELSDKAFVAYLNDRHAWKPLPVLVMDFCNGGDLRTHLQKIENVNGLQEFQIREVLRSLRYAVEYLHNQQNIKHRDLKPDNIVIHKSPNGKKIYKLTDFGFARHINDATMLQSVVGTRNYFAPEIVDTAKYTKTVDYWSIGIIAFELLCGILPFVPHQSIFKIITNIKSKPADCIAITEKIDEPDSFIFHKRIFAENHVTNTFGKRIEKWLPIALDKSHHTRGTALADVNEIPNLPGGQVTCIYTRLDEILQLRVLTVFSLTNYSLYDYDSTLTLKDLVKQIITDTKIPPGNLYFSLPIGHPQRKMNENVKRASDLFVEHWQDTSDRDNPPVMLYVINVDGTFQPSDPYISSVIQYCLIIFDAEIPVWLQQQFAREVHFLLNKEQLQLATFLNGLNCYALSMEEEILEFDALRKLVDEASCARGIATQFVAMIEYAKTAQDFQQKMTKNDEFFAHWLKIAESFREDILNICNLIKPKLEKRYASTLRRIKDECKKEFYDDYIKRDIYDVATFRHHLIDNHMEIMHSALSRSSCCKICRQTVYDLLDKRNAFFEDKKLITKRNEISFIRKEFGKIKEITENTLNRLKTIGENILSSTADFNRNLFNELVNGRLLTDGNGSEIEANANALRVTNATTAPVMQLSSSINEFHSFNEAMHMDTMDLIQNAMGNMQLMSMEWDANAAEIPTVVNNP